MQAPKYYDGKALKYEETFRSAFPKPTKELAEKVMDSIREAHDSAHGWLELDARIEETPEGFIAVRHHAQYK